MRKSIEKFFSCVIYMFCICLTTELVVNYFAFYHLFPIKNATSYGYISKKTQQTIIPLNKYSSRFKAQIALPYELISSKITHDKELMRSFDKKTQKYGYTDEKNNIVIEYKYEDAKPFVNDYAIVAILKNDKKKYGTIDKHGKWIIEPKYDYLCPFAKYYTKACIDGNHCGVLDRFGNEITLMSYKTDKLNCKGAECQSKICAIGKKNQAHCNYFL